MSVEVEVWGDYACFSRPEMKVERVSYDIMTPSAARGILEAIYWHPGMQWCVDEIQVCNPVKWLSVRCNEVKSKLSGNKAKSSMDRNCPDELMLITSQERTQRMTVMLRDVRYIIKAHFELTDKSAPTDSPAKFISIFNRRVEMGQCYHNPYFGCRDFPVKFGPHTTKCFCPVDFVGEKDLGYMLFDMDYSDPEHIKPMFFRAVLRNGVLTVPDVNSAEVLR